MKTEILSDITQQANPSKLMRFAVVFTAIGNNKEEYIFFDNSLTNCIKRCTALINYMFQVQHMHSVYIFPTNSTLTRRTVYGRSYARSGNYRMLECKKDSQLTFEYVRYMFPL